MLHSIFLHKEEVECLYVEAEAEKITDGIDIARARAIIPYRNGEVGIHSLSALSITKVEIEKGQNKLGQLLVNMNNPTGIFQIEKVLERKLKISGIQGPGDVVSLEKGIEIKRTV